MYNSGLDWQDIAALILDQVAALDKATKAMADKPYANAFKEAGRMVLNKVGTDFVNLLQNRHPEWGEADRRAFLQQCGLATAFINIAP